MKSIRIVSLCLLLMAMAAAADTIPAGTIIPVMLSSTIDTAHNKPGDRIVARVMQDVPLPSGSHIPARSRVLGQVVDVNNTGAASRVIVKFDRVLIKKKEIPVVTDLRAIASMVAVYDAQIPTNPAPDRGTSAYTWTTRQVGGDVVYRGGGPVTSGSLVVGTPANGNGVVAQLSTPDGAKCRGSIEGSADKQALWVFSSSACGAYGFDDLKIEHAGRTAPIGKLVLQSSRKVHVPAGSGLLLRVVNP
ncbi:MAG TPA: hypothetical protein VEG30_08800 [Terriglobales bacterium]|nr:hypothetical protein [Terriglobales bacterium]